MSGTQKQDKSFDAWQREEEIQILSEHIEYWKTEQREIIHEDCRALARWLVNNNKVKVNA